MKLVCAYCADVIAIDESYWHFNNLDLNYHKDCLLSSELMMKKELRVHQDD